MSNDGWDSIGSTIERVLGPAVLTPILGPLAPVVGDCSAMGMLRRLLLLRLVRRRARRLTRTVRRVRRRRVSCRRRRRVLFLARVRPRIRPMLTLVGWLR